MAITKEEALKLKVGDKVETKIGSKRVTVRVVGIEVKESGWCHLRYHRHSRNPHRNEDAILITCRRLGTDKLGNPFPVIYRWEYEVYSTPWLFADPEPANIYADWLEEYTDCPDCHARLRDRFPLMPQQERNPQ